MAHLPHPHASNYNSIEKVEAYWNRFKPPSTSEVHYQEKWLAQSSFFETIALHTRVCVTLWDTLSNRFIFTADPTGVLGDNSSQLTKENGIDYTMSKCHPAQLEGILVAQQLGIQYCIDHKAFLPFKIILHLDCLYQRNDEYIRMLQQATVVETDENNHPLLFLSYIHDITHIKKQDSLGYVISSPEGLFVWNYDFDKKQLLPVKPITQRKNRPATPQQRKTNQGNC